MEQLSRPSLEEGTIQVLLVEDDERLARLTARYLQEHGLVVTLAHSGSDALVESNRHVFDVILLDLMLPGRDGLEVCRDLRGRTDVPIIMVTARGEEADRVLGLETGADDYLAKPYSSRELLARIRAQVRRARGKVGPSSQPVQAGRLMMDPRSLRATLDGRALHLTTYEFSLLRVLAERAGRVLSREQLLDLVKGSADEVFDRSVDVHIFRLRQKLEVDPRNPLLLKTVRGAGYMLATGEES
ncbi:response regulator transcription factor [Myxococcus sp. XM-1-1-1]|jgi:DNA-binding response OmpR family regulator|uniref:response regulator transcription factor n=1 Tax=Myxococcus sp. XM-1-1-1 TaxID=2874602 RepID=UPI001CC134B7|nr:response regulator transcription factor [Myxococcus sp. XM-1-1-1]MBZ4414491.1 response regulator transcription factor [Myxococcus sp. XM-1-1-1]BDT30596.1 response regulator transcription factor [Myxococcus sp. MH1]